MEFALKGYKLIKNIKNIKIERSITESSDRQYEVQDREPSTNKKTEITINSMIYVKAHALDREPTVVQNTM